MPDHISYYEGIGLDPSQGYDVMRTAVVQYDRKPAWLAIWFRIGKWRQTDTFPLTNETEIIVNEFDKFGSGHIQLKNSSGTSDFWIAHTAPKFLAEVKRSLGRA